MTNKLFSVGYLRIVSLVLVFVFLFASVRLMADPPATDMPPEQIETLVAPIALYPDPLISQILVASTYPLELVQAGQWLQQHPELQGQALKDASTQQSWDPSVQALVLFPDLMKRLNADVNWTTNLGNAFLANQGTVMDAIQRMRVRAQQAGKLQSTDQEKVTTTTQSGQPVVEIQPASPEVIYVPTYDPVWIWGRPSRYYYASWYYPPPPPVGVWFVWGSPYSMGYYYPGWHTYGGWGGWGWRPGWHDHAVIVNTTFVTTNHYNVVNITNVHNNAVWVHNPAHRMGVAYSSPAVAQHFNTPGAGRPALAHPMVNQTRQPSHAPNNPAHSHAAHRKKVRAKNKMPPHPEGEIHGDDKSGGGSR